VDSALLDQIEEMMREQFGQDIMTERSVDDITGTVTVKVYRTASSLALTFSIDKPLVAAWETGALPV